MRSVAAVLVAAALAAPARAADERPAPGIDPLATATTVDPSLAATALAPAGAESEPGDGARTSFSLEFGAYYTSAGLYVPLTRDPIPNVGEKTELELYWALLPRSFPPRFLVVEASVNPMPCLGLLARAQAAEVYDASAVYPGMNLVRAVTAGFEEPWAVSLFLGNVVDFDVAGRKDTEGKGYFGGVLSAGNWHLKDNVLVDDPWVEAEAKLKGDRRSPVKKLSWSFRVGTKLHGNPDVVSSVYVGIRRSRVDYAGGSFLVANSGVEWRLDLGFDGAVQHQILLVDKKWPLRSAAFSVAVGLLWDRGTQYRGALATPPPRALQLLLRPNVEF